MNKQVVFISDIHGNYDEAVGFYLPTCGCSIESGSDKQKAKNALGWAVEHTALPMRALFILLIMFMKRIRKNNEKMAREIEESDLPDEFATVLHNGRDTK